MTYLVIHNVGLYLSRKNNLPICTSIRPGVQDNIVWLLSCNHTMLSTLRVTIWDSPTFPVGLAKIYRYPIRCYCHQMHGYPLIDTYRHLD